MVLEALSCRLGAEGEEWLERPVCPLLPKTLPFTLVWTSPGLREPSTMPPATTSSWTFWPGLRPSPSQTLPAPPDSFAEPILLGSASSLRPELAEGSPQSGL